ncbi:hypothetical protein FI667_g1960, partial [Globisporangium splendens]
MNDIFSWLPSSGFRGLDTGADVANASSRRIFFLRALPHRAVRLAFGNRQSSPHQRVAQSAVNSNQQLALLFLTALSTKAIGKTMRLDNVVMLLDLLECLLVGIRLAEIELQLVVKERTDVWERRIFHRRNDRINPLKRLLVSQVLLSHTPTEPAQRLSLVS